MTYTSNSYKSIRQRQTSQCKQATDLHSTSQKKKPPWPVNVGSSAQPPPWSEKCRGNHMWSFYSPTKMAKWKRRHVPRGDLQTLACIAREVVGSICKSQCSATYVLALPLLGMSLRQIRVQYARKFIHVRCSQKPYFWWPDANLVFNNNTMGKYIRCILTTENSQQWECINYSSTQQQA